MRDRIRADLGDDPQDRFEQRLTPRGAARTEVLTGGFACRTGGAHTGTSVPNFGTNVPFGCRWAAVWLRTRRRVRAGQLRRRWIAMPPSITAANATTTIPMITGVLKKLDPPLGRASPDAACTWPMSANSARWITS